VSDESPDGLVLRAFGVVFATCALLLAGAIAYSEGSQLHPIGIAVGVALTPGVRWLVGRFPARVVHWPMDSETASDSQKQGVTFVLGLIGLVLLVRVVVAGVAETVTLRWVVVGAAATYLFWIAVEGVRWLVADVAS
jgi:hypothetical protein